MITWSSRVYGVKDNRAMFTESVQKFSVFSLVLECIEMHCFNKMLVFITVSKGSLVGFHYPKVSEAQATTFEAYVASSPCFAGLVRELFYWYGSPSSGDIGDSCSGHQ